MRKSEIVKEIVQKTGTSTSEVEIVVETLMKTIVDQVTAKQSVSLRRFGTFTLKKRKAKTARDIRKNAPIYLPERYIAWFKPAKSFSKRVKNQLKDSK